MLQREFGRHGHLARNQGSFATADSNVSIPGVTEFPIITSDVTNVVPIAIAAISKIKSMMIGTYGNSDGNPSNGSTSTIKDDFIVLSETTSKSDEHGEERT